MPAVLTRRVSTLRLVRQWWQRRPGTYLAPAMENFYGIPYERFERWSPAGRPKDVAEFIAAYVEVAAASST